MKKRIEDQILLLAYGELDAGEAEALTRRIEADPALRALYEEHARVRDATRAVPEPPAPSLSSERLRERILSESATRRTAGWGWAFAGGGVALAGVLAVLAANLPVGSGEDNLTPQQPTLTIALHDLPAPHEWVPALIDDISEQPQPEAASDRPAPLGRSHDPAAESHREDEAGVVPETAVTQPATDATKGAVGDDMGPGEATVVVIGANGSAVEFEGTDGVAFGG